MAFAVEPAALFPKQAAHTVHFGSPSAFPPGLRLQGQFALKAASVDYRWLDAAGACLFPVSGDLGSGQSQE